MFVPLLLAALPTLFHAALTYREADISSLLKLEDVIATRIQKIKPKHSRLSSLKPAPILFANLAMRVKAVGMSVYLDLHLSDHGRILAVPDIVQFLPSLKLNSHVAHQWIQKSGYHNLEASM
ncbi:endo-1,4-beta-galactanase A [Aspergillus luchuensis]|uniref:Endo-1,4-beta-galactanase A n=1 Tax=Aspergillus kawachii TaxID=1069201 RepID=A0A146G3E0_ASPKA|nr:endo-1,4-beta-galactanase A [Aspergillus luchuensis]